MMEEMRMKKTMNKVVTMGIVGLAGLVFLSACGGDQNKSSDTKEQGEGQLEKIKSAGKLVLGTSPDFPPAEFYVLKDGKKEIVGSDVALAQAIADEIGVTLEIKPTDFNGVLANIQTGSVDLGIASFVGTDERSEVMDFSEGYQQEVSDGFQGVLMKKEEAKKYKSLEELKEAKITIGAQAASIQYELATTLTDEKKIKQFGTMDAAILALNAGDVEALTVSTSSAEPMLESFPDLEILPKEAFDLDAVNKYAKSVIGFPKGNDNKDLIEIANKIIKENLDNGTLAKWREEYKKMSVDAIE